MEGIFVLGIISILATLFLRLLAVLDEMYSTRFTITKNLHQLHEYEYGSKTNLQAKKDYLYELNQSICKKLNITPPPIYLQDNDTNNAQAINTGFFQAVLFEYKTFVGLDAQGLGAVLAHELYHIQQKHYLKSLVRHLFICVSWLLLNMFLLMHLVDSLNLPEPTSKGENYYWVLCLMLVYTGASLVGDQISTAVDRWVSRRQEIECDIFSAEATSFGDYLMEAHYFKENEDFWAQPRTGLRALKFQVYSTHPNWDKRIVSVASVNSNRK